QNELSLRMEGVPPRRPTHGAAVPEGMGVTPCGDDPFDHGLVPTNLRMFAQTCGSRSLGLIAPIHRPGANNATTGNDPATFAPPGGPRNVETRRTLKDGRTAPDRGGWVRGPLEGFRPAVRSS